MDVRNRDTVVILGTGGTIAGRAASPGDDLAYSAAQIGIGDLLGSVPGLSQSLEGHAIESEQIAQIDSKDMDLDTMARLARAIASHVQRPGVRGVVVTHGTDTLEETAYFLGAVLSGERLAGKPVVLTCAMRPANALMADGPQNLLDAIALVLDRRASGVLAVCAGAVHAGDAVRKTHPWRLDAFGSGDAGPLAWVEGGRVRWVSFRPQTDMDKRSLAIEKIAESPRWPRVELLTSHAGASGALVDTLVAANPDQADPVRGLVVAGTGNGTLHRDLEAALLRAQAAGIHVWRSTRCSLGQVIPVADQRLPDAAGLPPVQARIALILELLCQADHPPGSPTGSAR
ncbi:MAG: asparaginase [Rhodoferax sp.]|nr:asparaginase [Rhodoferax sp.]